MIKLSNRKISVEVSKKGAELCSIRGLRTKKEYLWQADPAFWNRHSPVLFPIVGRVWGNEYRHGGIIYSLSQHGFARDMDFSLLSVTDTEIWFRLESDISTLGKYPFPFILEIGYRLLANQIIVSWRVENPSNKGMYFQIGAHPGFYFPAFKENEEERGYFMFNKSKGLYVTPIVERGCVTTDRQPLELVDGLLPIDVHTFDNDALILENSQVNEVTLLDVNKKPHLSVRFDAPVVGLWSPPAKNAPFVCIEPWYGRCDRVNFEGDFREKDWIQYIPLKGVFETSYTITLEKE